MHDERRFMGIPVDGDIIRPSDRADQRPRHELEPLLRAVLTDGNVVAVGWTQYTPYFNDGDPCIFRAGEPWFQLVGDPDVFDDHDVDAYEHTVHVHEKLMQTRWSSEARAYVPVDVPLQWRDTARRCGELHTAISSGAFNDVLLTAFGDHAEVRVTRDGISVRRYEHE